MKRTKQRIAMLLSAASLISCLAGCGSNASGGSSGASSTPAPTSSAPAEEKLNYEGNVGASNSGGSMFRWNVSACDLVNKYNEGIVLSPMTTIGSSENVELTDMGECAFGTASSFISYLAYSGQAAWEGGALDNLRVVMSMYQDSWMIAVPADSDIQTLEDLYGKRVSMDAKGTSADVNLMLLDALGIDGETDFEPFFVTVSDAATAMQEGTIDAFMTVGAPTASAFSTLNAGRGIRFLDLTEEQQKTLCEAIPLVSACTADVSMWNGCDTYASVGASAIVLANKDVPDEVVYAYAKTLQEHHDEHVSAAGNATWATAEKTVELWGSERAIPLHPGAKQYYQELGLM